MRVTELLRLVCLNINQNKFKSVMTSIGIVVGAATVMLVLGIGRGGKMDIAEQFAQLNAGEINITYKYAGEEINTSGGTGIVGASGNVSGRSGGKNNGKKSERGEMNFGGGEQGSAGKQMRERSEIPSGEGREPKERPDLPEEKETKSSSDEIKSPIDGRLNQSEIILSKEDVTAIEEDVTGITGITLSYTVKTTVEGGNLISGQSMIVAGVEDTYEDVSKLQMKAGYFVTEEQNAQRARICALGSEIAEDLFDDPEKAVGQKIFINDRAYTVTGVLESSGMISGGITLDSSVFVPYETGVKYITGNTISPKLTVIAEDVDSLQEVIAGVKRELDARYDNADFTFEDSGSKMKSAQSSNHILTMLLTAMAGIVFLIGGIGIMNVLFVSVKERTNEIGILKAIGTARSDILLEFLMESAAISMIGGALGVGISFLLVPLVQYFQVRVEITGKFVLIALGFAVLTGTVFGIYPAWKASKLEPVEALNAE